VINVITNELPSAVVVGGSSLPINTDFRTSIQVQELIESDLPPDLVGMGVVMHYFGNPDLLPADIVSEHLDGLIAAAMEFARMDEFAELTRSRKGSKTRTFDWCADQRRLVADFQREYGIDLTDADTELHWWRFMMLFEGLSDKSATMTAIGYRTLDIPPKAPDEERKRLREMKNIYQLPPRTKAEVLARDAAIWGDEI
jgi:hypothetical protein